MKTMLKGEHITVRYGDFTAVNDLSFALKEGQWRMLVGPNGAGKSTLIETIAQGVPYTGSVLWQGKDIRTMKSAEIARSIGVLSQKNVARYSYTVEEVVGLGRYAYRAGFFSGRDTEGKEWVERALRLTDLTGLRRSGMLSLSGGETQRVFLAQVFAQNPQVLLLDEPANHLDLKYQQQIFSLIQAWNQEPGHAVISVVHDISLAKRYGTHALLMDHGQKMAEGEINGVLTPNCLQNVYHMDVCSWMRDLYAQWA